MGLLITKQGEREKIKTPHKQFFFFVYNKWPLNTSALRVANESESYDWTRAGASIELVPLLWNSHSCNCLRCSDHVDLCRIECDNGTMPYAHRLMPELERWLRPPVSSKASAPLRRGRRHQRSARLHVRRLPTTNSLLLLRRRLPLQSITVVYRR